MVMHGGMVPSTTVQAGVGWSDEIWLAGFLDSDSPR
jgi:hypothetical protein